MSPHKEIDFENEICEHLSHHGWLYQDGDAAHYDRARALYPRDVIAWVQETQGDAWASLVKNHGSRAEDELLNRLRQQLDQRGTLELLRRGFEMVGLRRPLMLAQFKPALGLNPELQQHYAANRLRVVRQLRFSLHKQDSIDLVLFLNGLAVATVELKSDFTQDIRDAVDQYRYDRRPQDKGRAPEPLLAFPNGALVHFAVSNAEVQMATRLEGKTTRFLPFNRGNDEGAGNPVNPDGHRSAYLWEQVWERHSWLEIMGRYLIHERNSKRKISRLIFPRYHQLDVTRKLQAAVLADGVGASYLIQHSAGSGKTNSIAWTAHFLAELHDAQQHKLFDTVLVVSDRNVIDRQLHDALDAFQRTSGVVTSIDARAGSKSKALTAALAGEKQIVICTVQTFPHALKQVRELAATMGKCFAVIADEAHSSQSGEAADHLKQLLSPEQLAELADGGAIDSEDFLNAQMTQRAERKGISFIAFTATPKQKTMELFGTRPHPTRPPNQDDNLPVPFHVYTMRQAIEEGFILDVLQNYTSYDLAFQLAHQGVTYDEETVERSAALKGIMGWVKLHPHNIAQKVKIVVDHYRQHISKLLKGQAKAMVVVASRQAAVRWKLAMDKYITSHGYKIGTLVAFSGNLTDLESGPEPFSETSALLNPDLRGRDIREAFKGDDYQILLVANKYQTGFDQPLLCAMYVDKRLADLQAVQTLSRLNRAYEGKDKTYILDFVNEPEEILKAFKTYYRSATLATTTDPNLIYDLKAKLDGSGHYDEYEVDRVVEAVLRGTRQRDLVVALEPVADRLLRRFRELRSQQAAAQAAAREAEQRSCEDELKALALFKSDLETYVRLYIFLAQIFDYGNNAVEKRYLFYKHLVPLLEFGREREGIDLSKVVLTHHNLRSEGRRDMNLAEGEKPMLKGITALGSGTLSERQRVNLQEVIDRLNDLFGGELNEHHSLNWFTGLEGTVRHSATLIQQASSNSPQQFAQSPDLDEELIQGIMSADEAHSQLSAKALNSPELLADLKQLLLKAGLYEKLRAAATTPAPLRLIEDPPQQRRWTELVPYVDLAVAAGSFSAAQDAGQAQLEQSRFWVEVAEHRVKRGYFAARIEGHSMEPQIEDGSLCLFEPVLGAPKTGSIVLAALRDQSDSEHGGRYTIKTYRSEKTTDENGVAQNTVIHLEPKNPAYPRLSFTAENGEGLTILAKYAATLEGA